MFPPADVAPDYPTAMAYSFVLLTVLCIPNFISWDRRLDGRATLGIILRPFTRAADPIMEFLVMFARVWLATSWANAATAQFLADYCPWTYCATLGCLCFIL